MFKTSLKKLILLAILPVVCLAAAARAEAPMNKAQVEQIVHDYLMAHGEVILQSVNDFQTKSTQAKQSEGVQSNKDALFHDESSPFIGNASGDVTIVEFFDYNCGYCKKAFTDLKAVADGDKNVKIIFKEFPILGPSSETAAKWALAAHKQKKYFAFHQKMMEHQGPVTDAVLEQIGKDAGLDVAAAKAAVGGADIQAQIDKNRALAGQMSIGGTPAFIVGEEVMAGAVGKAALEEKIAEIRKKKTK